MDTGYRLAAGSGQPHVLHHYQRQFGSKPLPRPGQAIARWERKTPQRVANEDRSSIHYWRAACVRGGISLAKNKRSDNQFRTLGLRSQIPGATVWDSSDDNTLKAAGLLSAHPGLG